MKENVIEVKSFDFAVRIVNLYKYLATEKKEFVLSKQLLRSGTSIGANVSEAQMGQSKSDFNAKMYIALKVANETQYWLKLLFKTEYLTKGEFDSIENDIKEIIALLISITKSVKMRNE
ncbi:MAG: four helix bundle protein [Clostridia bacterium]|nr:four helix bundle protein [Clostridia bacterium]